ncbi:MULTISPECIES: cytochrome c biogenesis heme-transporting ATPase CcmA [unclassified Undibacterium]|uniref:cytochrome c biogenesis heme-transporting ATPase CcmA n=1 Tax=unclassified Undibacterium TaxID=2630295 RepID=UPI002AC9A540|nr:MULTISPECIES: cytochrome c biogenesis heme-transporting ATPase CcmA [unclassified Undibacterium]MEB0140583.1 cytochrome c biogenesis heme-transporting ATPase CcmA [Undibacterium sp. CCC2.1]MEB0173637.1 cytochrome c biogenesis heme-transporting ATPase CcmA [Undibacterium sp. CCC1.1]MEB0177349.1 cytochrome c biogenesis heme-transporting ATPase CcmA [Undibacterium sp. CCC3.4]MEB0216761.1 cytochrome c biogenesis heme-transporting ATPase CcmA [Undibacterium sp. 5I2]WPX44560.1 cytochrome c biogen
MLSANGLTCLRGKRQLFSGLSLALVPGEWLHIRGDNGAGKTSLLRMLAGLSEPTAGSVAWDGRDIATCPEEFHRHLLFLGHHEALKDELSALENLLLAAALDGQALGAVEVCAALARFGLRGREQLPVGCLSAGQKRRVLLARLLTRHATLWILDEPFTALDVAAVAALSELITQHLSSAGMVIMTSHQAIGLAAGKVLQL